MRVFGVYGLKLSKDLHQAMFQAAFDFRGVSDALYQSMTVSPLAFTGAIESAAQADFAGLNILWPYQEYLTEVVDETDELVDRAFCANMMIASGNMLSAFNTIGPGMMAALQNEKQYDVKDKQVLLIGAGAMARTWAVMLAGAGAGKIMMANRTPERAETNAKELTEKLGREILGCGWDAPDLGVYMQSSDLVINCTFLGDHEHLNEKPLPELLENLHGGQLVIDICANPAVTPFLQTAAAQGADTMPGYLITLYEGVETYKMWFNTQDVPIEHMRDALEIELGIKQSDLSS